LVDRYGVKSVEMVVERVDPDDLGRLQKLAVKVLIRDPKALFVFDQENVVDEALTLVHKSQGRLISLVRQKDSLEDLFMKEVKESSGQEK